MAGPVLEIEGLRKAFGPRVVLDGVSMTAEAGGIVGLLGPNGAGKTTLLNILAGLVKADAGSVRLFGTGGPGDPRLRLRMGFLQEKPSLYPEMTARSYLTFFARLYGVPGAKARIADLLARLSLTAAADRELRNFSRGMQQRVCLARALLHRPELLVLDEPTLGLDPSGVAEMRALFLDLRREGVTLLFSSHQLAEMEKVCDRVVLLDRGRVIAAGPKAALVPQLGSAVRLVVEAAEAGPGLAAALRAMPGVVAVAEGPGGITLDARADGPAEVTALRAAIARRVIDLGAVPLSVRQAEVSLEDVFLMLTGAGAATLDAAA